MFVNHHPWDTNPAWPKDASTSLLQALAPGDRKINQWEVLVLAAPPGSASYGTPPPESLLHKMFAPISGSNDPTDPDGGLGISPSAFMRSAPHSGWSNEDAPGQDHCFWRSDK